MVLGIFLKQSYQKTFNSCGATSVDDEAEVLRPCFQKYKNQIFNRMEISVY